MIVVIEAGEVIEGGGNVQREIIQTRDFVKEICIFRPENISLCRLAIA